MAVYASRPQGLIGPKDWLLPSRELFWRIPIAAAAVLICYQFHWEWLRYLSSQGLLEIARAFGTSAARVTFDSILLNSVSFSFDISCSFADVFCFSLPFLWIRGEGLPFNGRRIGAFAAYLFVLNQVRVAVTYGVFRLGAPWRVSDLTVGSFAYAVVWIYLTHGIHRHSGLQQPPERA